MPTAATETKFELREALKHYLKHGEENAITGPQLASILGLKNTRQMRLELRALIDEGIPVCGSPHPPYGYFIANSAEEINRELNTLKYGYGRELYRRYKALRRAGRSLLQPGQMKLL